MKRWSLLTLCLFVFAALVAPVAAQQSTTSATSNDELKKRVEERKTRLKTRLTTVESQRLGAKCAAAQQKLASFSNNGRQALTKYQAFIDRVEKLEQTLSAGGTKSSELLGEASLLKEKYQAINQAVSDLNQSVSDAKTLDCKQDPAAFKAALDDARAQAVAVKKAQVDFLQYVAKTVKPTLQTLKDKKS